MSNPKAVFNIKGYGKVTAELFLDKTPETVKNFIKQAEKGTYNGTRFHRVIPDFMIQGGDPLSKDASKRNRWGTGGPAHGVDCEIRPDLSHEAPGYLSMAHAGRCRHDRKTGKKISGKCTNGSQFFITANKTPHLDGVHTVFGRVTSGLEDIMKISMVETNRMDQPLQDVIVESVEIVQ